MTIGPHDADDERTRRTIATPGEGDERQSAGNGEEEEPDTELVFQSALAEAASAESAGGGQFKRHCLCHCPGSTTRHATVWPGPE